MKFSTSSLLSVFRDVHICTGSTIITQEALIASITDMRTTYFTE